MSNTNELQYDDYEHEYSNNDGHRSNYNRRVCIYTLYTLLTIQENIFYFIIINIEKKKYKYFESYNQHRKMVKIGDAVFSPKFFVASILIFIAGLCTLVSFAGPYWSQSYPSTGNEFKNIGLWEACFNRYRHWKDDNQKPYTGCFWFWSPDMIRFRDWLMPRTFIIYFYFL